MQTRYGNLYLVTASHELADLQSKLEPKFKINKLRRLLVELSEDYERIYIGERFSESQPCFIVYFGKCLDRVDLSASVTRAMRIGWELDCISLPISDCRSFTFPAYFDARPSDTSDDNSS